MTTVAYLLMVFLPRKISGKYVMLWCLFYLCYNHLYRLIYMFGEFNMDISTFTMLHVCKLSALGYCYHDGAKPENQFRPGQKERMVKDLPTVLEMMGYTWFVPQCALGVFYEFSDYKAFIEQTREYTEIPSPILPSLRTLGEAILCTGIFLVMNNYFWVEFIYDESLYGPCSFEYKVYYWFVAMTVKRFFYYGPFKFSTGGFQAFGLGYNGLDKKTGAHLWDKVVGCYVLEIETANSVTPMLRAWNHQVHLWLKFYILARI
jgi:lysophospholipid acyltransferase